MVTTPERDGSDSLLPQSLCTLSLGSGAGRWAPGGHGGATGQRVSGGRCAWVWAIPGRCRRKLTEVDELDMRNLEHEIVPDDSFVAALQRSSTSCGGRGGGSVLVLIHVSRVLLAQSGGRRQATSTSTSTSYSNREARRFGGRRARESNRSMLAIPGSDLEIGSRIASISGQTRMGLLHV